MLHHYADDGRVMTPPGELEPLLKDAFPVFIKLIGHIRLFYVADEVWDGKVSLVFVAEGEPLAEITLGEGAFDVCIVGRSFAMVREALLDDVFAKLKETVPVGVRRPFEQLTMNMEDPTKFPCGYRCDLCLLHKSKNESDFSASNRFGYWNWLCYHNCVPGISIERPDPDAQNAWACPGCASSPWKKECRYFLCPTEKGYASCMECGEYHSCDVQSDGHYAGQCNLGMTAIEVTSLVIPYCMKERFDIFRARSR